MSIVTFRPDLRLLERCLRKLVLAIGAAREDGVVRTVALALIDNSGDRAIAKEAIKLAQGRFKDANVQMTYLHGHANIGYGAAHNLVLHGSGADYHLVLNPDVELAPDALAVGVRWLAEHTEIGAIAPEVFDGNGERQEYLCRRYPAVFDLLLRGFMPRFLRGLFRRRLERYEMRDVIDPDPEREIIDIPAMSGACILVRRNGDRCDRRLRSEVLPLFRGLRLDGAAEPDHADGVRAVDAHPPPRRRRITQRHDAHRLVHPQRVPVL